MKRSISDESGTHNDDPSKRAKLSQQESQLETAQISQASSATVMPDRQTEYPTNTSNLSKVYATDSIPDNWNDALSITHLHLRTDARYDNKTYEDYPFNQFKIFAQLPNLKKLSMWGAGGIHIEDAGQYAEIPSRASGVTIMDLRNCQFGTSCLVKVIGFANGSLESFTYRTGGLESPDGSGAIINPGNVWAVLGESSATLRKLDVDFDENLYNSEYWQEREDYGDEEGSEEDEDGEVDDPSEQIAKQQMREGGKGPEFPYLTRLRIGIKALMSLMLPMGRKERLVEVLPKSLEELIIRGYDTASVDPEWKAQINEVQEQMGTKLPNLKTLGGIETIIPNGKDGYDRWHNKDEEDDEEDDDSEEANDGRVFSDSD